MALFVDTRFVRINGMTKPIRVTVWNEFLHEKKNPRAAEIYPEGMHSIIVQALDEILGENVVAKTATLEQLDHGLTDEVLIGTDVLIWWGHLAHTEVSDEVVDRVHARVLEGMGLIVLHSGHFSKIFRRLMGTGCAIRWREAGELERLWVVNAAHPITAGIEREYFELEQTEMYGEYFDIPAPDELIFISWFAGGEVFRSGCTFQRGRGKIFYFRPGHETYPIYYDKTVRRVIANAVGWAASDSSPYFGIARNVVDPLNPIS